MKGNKNQACGRGEHAHVLLFEAMVARGVEAVSNSLSQGVPRSLIHSDVRCCCVCQFSFTWCPSLVRPAFLIRSYISVKKRRHSHLWDDSIKLE